MASSIRNPLIEEAKLAHRRHVLMESTNGQMVDLSVSEAKTRAERQESLVMVR